MPWCPKCRNEYVEGMKECADCRCELVEALEEKQEAIVEEKELDLSMMKSDGVYQDSAAKAEDNKSSAYTLLFVGGIGIVAIALCMFGFIDLNLNETSKYMVYGVMGAMFILFIVMGVVSMRSYRIFAQKAQKEDNLTGEIRKWCLTDLSAEKVDGQLSEEEKVLGDELKYFQRTEILKKLIGEKFLNLDEAYLEHFVDDIYPEIFEDSK